MIAVIDYGMGNLRSVQKAIEEVGAKAIITQDPDDIKNAQKVVLPGVGAMLSAMEKLKALELISPIKDFVQSGRPFLGICLGVQLLFERSAEDGGVDGLALLRGSVERFKSLKVPHMGWNQIQLRDSDSTLFKNIEDSANVYFCHSYFVKPVDQSVIATTTEYGIEFVSSVCQNNLFGVQFHPEKSQSIGLKILKNFTDLSG